MIKRFMLIGFVLILAFATSALAQDKDKDKDKAPAEAPKATIIDTPMGARAEAVYVIGSETSALDRGLQLASLAALVVVIYMLILIRGDLTKDKV